MIKYYKKKPVTIKAGRWLQHGDHPEVLPGPMKMEYDRGQATIIQEVPIHPTHGWIKTLENAHEVTPGDYIIEGVRGEFYPCKPEIFLDTYEEVEVFDAEFVQR